MKVFVTREIAEPAIKLLKKHFDVGVYSKDQPIPRKELIDKIKDADGMVSLLTENFDKELIDLIPKCKIIANVAVGYNNIDIKYAAKKNIIVTNTPDVLTESTADLTMALILTCTRRIIEAEKFLRKGKFKGWKPKLLLGIELKDKVLGILGAGRIGTAVAKRAKSFGCKIIYFSEFRNKKLEFETGAIKTSLNNLLQKADIVSVHLPLNDKTFHLLNKERLSLLKKSAIIINTSRGEIIDEKELVRILKRRKIFSAGLDVFENEPIINQELLKLSNVVLLPHIGSATEEARTAMAMLAAKNVVAVLKGNKPLTSVNI
jgi:glyoxylate reductase